jgi:hypothetical protein
MAGEGNPKITGGSSGLGASNVYSIDRLAAKLKKSDAEAARSYAEVEKSYKEGPAPDKELAAVRGQDRSKAVGRQHEDRKKILEEVRAKMMGVLVAALDVSDGPNKLG